MALTFVGHSPTYTIWVFDLDGKQFVARNFSTPSPLAIKFVGVYPEPYSGSEPLIKTSGFDIISSTSQPTGVGAAGVVEWTWGGKRYRNTYLFTIGDVGADEESTLLFAAPIPYDGPAGGTVSNGVASQATVQAATKTKDEREAAAANAAQITPSAQLATGTAPAASPAPADAAKPLTTGVRSQASFNAARSNKTKEDIEASTAYKTYGYTPSPAARQVTSVPIPVIATTPIGMSKSPVLIPGTKDAREAAAAGAGTDWVKLGLQLGAAYLLFS